MMLDLVGYMVARQAATDARRAGLPRPWSDDPTVASCQLCSVVRDDDRTSVEAREYIQSAPPADRTSLARAFRYFNYTPTLRAVHQSGALRDQASTLGILKKIEALGCKVLGAQAFKINAPGGVWNLRGISQMTSQLASSTMMPSSSRARDTVRILTERGVSPFLAYQIMQDLRWVVGPYEDEDVWAWVGPGAARGLQRVAGQYGGPRTWEDRRFDSNKIAMKTVAMPAEMRDVMSTMLAEAKAALGPHISMFEMEHNLCEWDKYCRISTGESRGRKFTPSEERA